MAEDAQHTPGPWYYDDCVQIVEAARPHMRVCFLPSDFREHASSRANARLIAAAPDLLEALKAAREMLEQYEHAATGETFNDLHINAAIARAEGQS